MCHPGSSSRVIQEVKINKTLLICFRLVTVDVAKVDIYRFIAEVYLWFIIKKILVFFVCCLLTVHHILFLRFHIMMCPILTQPIWGDRYCCGDSTKG